MIQAVTSLLLASSEDFQPQDEFALHPWVSIHLGPIDLSINKAVVYLLVGAALTCIIGIWIMRFGLSPEAEPQADDGRVGLRARPDPDRRGEPPEEGAPTVVPVLSRRSSSSSGS